MNTIIIRIPETSYYLDKNTNLQWCVTDNGKKEKQVEATGKIEDFTSYYQSLMSNNSGNHYTIVLALPSTMVLYKNLATNEKHRKYLSSTLPYLVEEYLSDNIEEMHIQYSTLNNVSGHISVCAIKNNLIKEIIELFNQSLIPLDSLIAEAQLYHTEQNSISLILDKSSLIIVNKDDQGIVATNETIINYFDNIKTVKDELNNTNLTTDDVNNVILKYTANACQKDINLITNAVQNKLPIDTIKLENTIIDYISKTYKKKLKNNSIVDLRQGTYACKRKIGKFIHRWKPIAIALCFFFVIDVLVSTGLGFSYLQKKNDLWKTNTEKYIEIFPKDQQAIRALQKKDYKFDVQKMLKNRMKGFDQGTTDNTFLFVWYRLSAAIEESKLQSILEKIDYSSNSKKIKLEFSGGDIQEINKLKSILDKYNLDVQEDTKDKTKSLLVGKKT